MYVTQGSVGELGGPWEDFKAQIDNLAKTGQEFYKDVTNQNTGTQTTAKPAADNTLLYVALAAGAAAFFFLK